MVEAIEDGKIKKPVGWRSICIPSTVDDQIPYFYTALFKLTYLCARQWFVAKKGSDSYTFSKKIKYLLQKVCSFLIYEAF